MGPRMSQEEAAAALATMSEADFETVPASEEVDDATAKRLISAGRKLSGRPSLSAPGIHSPQITLRLPDAVNARLVEVAERSGRRRSDVVREALDRYLAAA